MEKTCSKGRGGADHIEGGPESTCEHMQATVRHSTSISLAASRSAAMLPATSFVGIENVNGFEVTRRCYRRSGGQHPVWRGRGTINHRRRWVRPSHRGSAGNDTSFVSPSPISGSLLACVRRGWRGGGLRQGRRSSTARQSIRRHRLHPAIDAFTFIGSNGCTGHEARCVSVEAATFRPMSKRRSVTATVASVRFHLDAVGPSHADSCRLLVVGDQRGWTPRVTYCGLARRPARQNSEYRKAVQDDEDGASQD